jgi:hypothetical protein
MRITDANGAAHSGVPSCGPRRSCSSLPNHGGCRRERHCVSLPAGRGRLAVPRVPSEGAARASLAGLLMRFPVIRESALTRQMLAVTLRSRQQLHRWQGTDLL